MASYLNTRKTSPWTSSVKILVADSVNVISRYIKMASLYWGILAVTVVLVLNRILQYGMRTKDLPPGNITVLWLISPDCGGGVITNVRECCIGPPTIPIIGNLPQMPTKNFHLGLQKLARQCTSRHIPEAFPPRIEVNRAIELESCSHRLIRQMDPLRH